MTTTATYTRCPRCGGSVYTYFDLDLREHILCCFHCGRDSGYSAPAELAIPERVLPVRAVCLCDWCGQEFTVTKNHHRTQRFCSAACSLKGRGKPARVGVEA